MNAPTVADLVASQSFTRVPQTILRGTGAWETEFLGSTSTALVFGAAVPVNLNAGSVFTLTLTSNAAFQFSNPTGTTRPAGSIVVVLIRNASGGAHGAGTFDTLYKVAANVPAIANGFSRAIVFLWDGTNMVELVRGATDVPN